jgi:hypothetical protein
MHYRINALNYKKFISCQAYYISMKHDDIPQKFVKCRYISPTLDCLAGGRGHAGCLDQRYHEFCEHREKAEHRMGMHRKPVGKRIGQGG